MVYPLLANFVAIVEILRVIEFPTETTSLRLILVLIIFVWPGYSLFLIHVLFAGNVIVIERPRPGKRRRRRRRMGKGGVETEWLVIVEYLFIIIISIITS